MASMTAQDVPNSALFVCFGCMHNVGVLTGLGGLEVLPSLPPEEAGILYLSGLATEAPLVLTKTGLAERFIAVDVCPLHSALRIVESAGFTPDIKINSLEDCEIQKGIPFTHREGELATAKAAIRGALNREDSKAAE